LALHISFIEISTLNKTQSKSDVSGQQGLDIALAQHELGCLTEEYTDIKEAYTLK
jgi:hypothetical protein